MSCRESLRTVTRCHPPSTPGHCQAAVSCANPTVGGCCVPGLTACSFTDCGPASAPCRDNICCPADQENCTTSHGPLGCDVAGWWVQGECCIDQYACGIPGQAPQLCCNPPANYCLVVLRAAQRTTGEGIIHVGEDRCYLYKIT
jgi:hypothetical protein